MRPYAVLDFLICLILGPFAPWIVPGGRSARKGFPGGGAALCAVFIAVYAMLWLAPLRWEWIAGIYLLLCAISSLIFLRGREPSFQRSGEQNPSGWIQSLSLAALVVYPCVFAYALSRGIIGLQVFSIHLPAAVYTEALSFALRIGTPAAVLLAFLIRRAGLRPDLRLILRLYGGALATIFWIAVGERCYALALHAAGVDAGEPLLFGFYTEVSFYSAVRGFFYAGGIFLGASYLAPVSEARVFFRRFLSLGLLVALGYAHCALLLGESNYFLSGLRASLYRHGCYQAYRTVSRIEIARLPHALHTPILMLDQAELASLQGREEEAGLWRRRVLKATEGKPYFAALRAQVQWEDAQLASHPGCVAADSTQWLRVPRALPGVTLDGDWYGLLSAVSFFHPEWSDFDLKKKLLEISPDIELSVPGLDDVPAIAEALDVFGIPFSACFPDSLELRAALKRGKIPFLNFEGRWTPLVGWDPCRRGFLCYRYPDSLKSNPWFNPADKEAVFGRGADSMGAESGEKPYNLIAFLPEREVMENLHDLGGVALILGDSNFAPSTERRAAYLTEYGDGLYQRQDDNIGAAEAYARAQSLHPSDYILARMVYLERRTAWSEGPDYGLDAVFREDVRSAPLPTGLNGDERRRMAGRILRGEMGQYLLLNWHEASPRFFAGDDSAERDSARGIFRTWLRLQPDNPAALDSLAEGFEAQAQWDSAETYYRRELGYYPMGDEDAAYRLAWALFKQERFQEMDYWLRRCPSFQDEARYLLLRGAADWRRGKRREGFSLLNKSLKMDKTLPETHAWMERMEIARGDSAGAALSRRWRERTDP